MKNNNSISNYLKQHFLQLLIILVSFAVSFAVIQSKVAANAEKIEEIKERVARYPSEQYFDLRFSIIEKRLDKMEAKIESLNNK